MVNEITDNIFLVNAPAGSGKTTWIKQVIQEYLIKYIHNNILCITFTNRAALELGKGIDSNRVYFGTIHNFINHFISSFFSHDLIIDFFIEVYKSQIEEQIENRNQKDTWEKRNERYRSEFGTLNLETIRANINSISYNEMEFSSLYRGKLGHDDLLYFARLLADNFPIIKKKIVDKYQLIFIDEYQDTSADILHLFYSSVLGSKSKLYLLGDRMQQIYKNYNGEFELEFKRLNKSISLNKNYRTTPKIVSILNNIYNDEDFIQYPYENNSDKLMDFQPKVFIVDDVVELVNSIKKKYTNSLVLYLLNRERFDSIGVGNLYDAYSEMEKYGFSRKYSSVDILTKEDLRDKDLLLHFLFLVDKLVEDCIKGLYGSVFKIIRNKAKYFNSNKYLIKQHSDKRLIKDLLKTIIDTYNDSSVDIDAFLSVCRSQDFIRDEFYLAVTEDPDYELVKSVKVREINLLSSYLNDPKVSTQHGVKGESHDTVIFVAENGNGSLSVNMSKFFEVWSYIDITLDTFEAFYYSYKMLIQNIENLIGMKCADLKADTYPRFNSEVNKELDIFALENKSNPYYTYLLKDKIDKYNSRNNVTNLKACLRENYIYSVLCAYRLFYVGCSRARKNLAIIISRDDVKSFEMNLCKKLESCGFEVYQ